MKSIPGPFYSDALVHLSCTLPMLRWIRVLAWCYEKLYIIPSWCMLCGFQMKRRGAFMLKGNRHSWGLSKLDHWHNSSESEQWRTQIPDQIVVQLFHNYQAGTELISPPPPPSTCVWSSKQTGVIFVILSWDKIVTCNLRPTCRAWSRQHGRDLKLQTHTHVSRAPFAQDKRRHQ